MARKKRKRVLPWRFRVEQTDFNVWVNRYFDTTRNALVLSQYHGEIARALICKSEPLVIIPGRVTGEQNYPLCVFRARLGDHFIEATLN